MQPPLLLLNAILACFKDVLQIGEYRYSGETSSSLTLWRGSSSNHDMEISIRTINPSGCSSAKSFLPAQADFVMMWVYPRPDQKNITDCIAIAKAKLNHTRFPLFCNPLPLQLRLNLICATTLATSQCNLGLLKDVLDIDVLEDSYERRISCSRIEVLRGTR